MQPTKNGPTILNAVGAFGYDLARLQAHPQSAAKRKKQPKRGMPNWMN